MAGVAPGRETAPRENGTYEAQNGYRFTNMSKEEQTATSKKVEDEELGHNEEGKKCKTSFMLFITLVVTITLALLATIIYFTVLFSVPKTGKHIGADSNDTHRLVDDSISKLPREGASTDSFDSASRNMSDMSTSTAKPLQNLGKPLQSVRGLQRPVPPMSPTTTTTSKPNNLPPPNMSLRMLRPPAPGTTAVTTTATKPNILVERSFRELLPFNHKNDPSVTSTSSPFPQEGFTTTETTETTTKKTLDESQVKLLNGTIPNVASTGPTTG